MEDVSTRVLIIGTSIFVTIVIVTLVLASFEQVKEIIGLTKMTDTSIHSSFNDVYVDLYSKYDGKSFNGMELVNLVKKLEDDPIIDVYVEYPNSSQIKVLADEDEVRESVYLKELMRNNTTLNEVEFSYEKQYNVTVEWTDNEMFIRFS